MGSISTPPKPKRDLVAVNLTEEKMKAWLMADKTITTQLPPNKILSDFFVCSLCDNVVDEITSVYKMCEAGHLVCYKCHSFVIKCPYEYRDEMMEEKTVDNIQFMAGNGGSGPIRPQLCLKPFRIIHSKVTFYILKHVAFTCKYKDLGCGKKFKCTKISDHERRFCKFRPRSTDPDAPEDFEEVEEEESDDEVKEEDNAKKLETIVEEEDDLITFD